MGLNMVIVRGQFCLFALSSFGLKAEEETGVERELFAESKCLCFQRNFGRTPRWSCLSDRSVAGQPVFERTAIRAHHLSGWPFHCSHLSFSIPYLLS